MTASAGQLIDLQGGKHKAFVAWARPPIYFCQLLPDAATGVLPTVHHRRENQRA
jgi:arginine/ornithine N-succinyltransferase beta subunit